jgi:hypothetical protein
MYTAAAVLTKGLGFIGFNFASCISASGLIIPVLVTNGVTMAIMVGVPLAPWVICASGLVFMIVAAPISGAALKLWLPFAGSCTARILRVKTFAIRLVAALAKLHPFASALASALILRASAHKRAAHVHLQQCAPVSPRPILVTAVNSSPRAGCVCVALILRRQ